MLPFPHSVLNQLVSRIVYCSILPAQHSFFVSLLERFKVQWICQRLQIRLLQAAVYSLVLTQTLYIHNFHVSFVARRNMVYPAIIRFAQ